MGQLTGGTNTQLHCKDESLARQSEQDAADINVIVKRFTQAGLVPAEDPSLYFADVSEVGTFADVLERVEQGRKYFYNKVPAVVRARFDHDPAKFLDFMANPENRDEAVELGLIPKPPDEGGSADEGKSGDGGGDGDGGD